MDDGNRRSIPESVEGTKFGDFQALDWAQLGVTAGLVGSAFLLVAVALRSLHPGTIAFGRAALGAAALALLPSARRPVARIDWPRLVLASVTGIAGPLLMLTLAVERIPSALVGMLVAAVPIATAAVAAAVTRAWPTMTRLTGLSVGFVGIAMLTAPNLKSSGTETLGVVLVLATVLVSAVSATLFAPLQQTYGSLPVTLWLLAISSVILSPLGLIGLDESRFEWSGIGSLLILGIASTGVAWTIWISLIGRVGMVRGSINGYVIPIVALVLGVIVLDEHLEAIQIAGVVVVLSGGYLLSRRRDWRTKRPPRGG